MIIVTGALGFIGSAFVSHLNQMGYTDIIVVDDFYQWKKEKNLQGKRIHDWVHRDLFLPYFEKIAPQVDVIFHLGARTDTISEDVAVFNVLNLEYSKSIWKICTAHDIPMVYASSAATYGDGSQGFDDDHSKVSQLKPLNAYAASKQQFDAWVLQQTATPKHWYGLKFFNVFGPNEYHKSRMASVVFHAFHQIRESGSLNLFKSHKPGFEDGGQLRDFIYVKDVVRMVWDIYHQHPSSGLYNVGTGTARTFASLGESTFAALGLASNIQYIDMPADLRDKYQYFTEANMKKWIAAGLPLPATPLENAIDDYVKNFLSPGKFI